MSYLRWVRLLLAALALQLSSVAPLWAQGDLSFIRQDFGVNQSLPPSFEDRPRAVTVGDFDGDGQQDLAAATGFAYVSILLGNGDGTFEPDQVFGQGLGDGVSIAAGDLNGDSQQDLATAASSDSFVA